MVDKCLKCGNPIYPPGVTFTGSSCFYQGKHPNYAQSANGHKCGQCGSTAIDHTEAQCLRDRTINFQTNIKPLSELEQRPTKTRKES